MAEFIIFSTRFAFLDPNPKSAGRKKILRTASATRHMSLFIFDGLYPHDALIKLDTGILFAIKVFAR